MSTESGKQSSTASVTPLRGAATDAASASTAPKAPSGEGPAKPGAEKDTKKKAPTPPKANPTKASPTTAKPAPPLTAAAAEPALSTARWRTRHLGIALSFLLAVALPSGLWYWYLQNRASDQYASYLAFSARSADTSPAFQLLGGISQLGGNTGSDTDVLYEYIQSQSMVALIDQQLDLRSLFSKPENDPIFGFDTEGSIEDLVAYWQRMVQITYDPGPGLIEVRALAFNPIDAQAIAQAIFDESSRTINELSDIARSDATRYAEEELETALGRLRDARRAIAEFRNKHRIIDPSLDVQAQMEIISALEQQKTEALIEMDLLRGTTRDNDPRMTQVERRLQVIESRIDDERRRMGAGLSGSVRGDDESYSSVIGEFEGLGVDREFAEQTYLSALAAYDQAQAEARRQSRYLAPHVRPTLAERALFPKRIILWSVASAFLFLAWAVLVLVYYSFRERR